MTFTAPTEEVQDGFTAPDSERVSGTSFDTPLSSTEEISFQKWKSQYGPNDSGDDYDLRGAYKAGLTPNDNGHWPDTFKKPNHPTFSDESIYAKDAPNLAGHWNGETFIPHGKNGGFIAPDDGGKDMFVHITAVERAGLDYLREGDKVTYDVVDSRGKPVAGNLRLK